MNVYASALAEAHLPDEQTSAFAREAIGDLSQRPKRLSPKYFYDATGSELFEAITRLPEYYPTRTELSILRDRGSEIAAIIPKGAALIEFGAGATTKVRLLLEKCTIGAYVPVDISGDFLKEQADWIPKHLGGNHHGKCLCPGGPFTNPHDKRHKMPCINHWFCRNASRCRHVTPP